MKLFPFLSREKLKSIPWEAIEPGREQANINHGQTLERLAERGGLSVLEAYAVLNGLRWHQFRALNVTEAEAVAFLVERGAK